MEKYNKYGESLYLDCGCDEKTPTTKESNNCCGGINLPSHDNEIEVLIRQLKKEVANLMKTTQAKLLCQDKKISETMVYIKNNLSNAIRNLLDSMLESGELEDIITSIIENNQALLESKIEELEQRVSINEESIRSLFNQVELSGVAIQGLSNKTNTNTTDIENLKSKVDTLEIKQDKLVVFGDSWSDPDVPDAIWSSTLASELNLTNINYAKDSAGFVQPSSNLISTQIANFRASDVVKETVKYIVVMGGINDYNNGVSAYDLYEEIKTCLDTLQSICPNAKILYVSNCKYPYTKNQLYYWYQVHNAVLKYNSLNLINKVGLPLFSNSYHLTQVGQIWLAKNINACLTGGELLTYLDTRTFEDNNIKIDYSTIPLSNNSAMVSLAIYIKNSLSSGTTINTGDTGINYGGETGLFGTVGTNFRNVVADTTENSITVGFSDTVYSGAYYYLNQVIYTQNT